MTTIQKKVQKKVEEVNKLISLASNSESENAYEGNLMVVNSGSTWQEPMVYKPVKFTNGVLYIEYYEPYSHKTTKEKILSRDLELDGYGTLLDIAKMYRKALKSENITFAYGGSLVGNQKRIDLNKNGKIDAEDFKLLRSSMNGASRNERKHVNHNEDYEVRYAKKRPSRTGYKGKRDFAVGGKVDSKLTEKEVDKIAKETAKVLGSKFSVTKGSVDNGSFDLDYDGIEYDGGSYIVLENGDVKNVAVPESPIVYNHKTKMKYAFGGMFGGRTYSTGRAYTNDKKHVNHSEEHEVKYIKKHPNQKRHGYGGMKYNAGGSLENHGLKKGDRIIKTIDGGIQEVKDKDGNIVYVNLANGERSADIPLPFDNGGSLGTFSIEEFKKKQIASQREKEKGENFKKFKVNVYEQDKSGAYPFIDSLFTDNFAEAFNFAKIIIEKQRSYRGNSGVLWATIDKFTPIEDRMNVIYPYSEISRFTEEDLQKSKYDDGGEVTYFVNKDGIKVRSVAKPDKELSEKEWMAKHSETNEARAYADGGKVEHYDLDKEKLNADAQWYADRIISGKMTTTKESLLEDIEGYNKDLYLLEIGRIKPSKVIGTGYKGNTKKIANTWLLEQIYIKKKILELLEGKMLVGGKVTFKEKARAIAKNFVGKPVKPKYQKEYGKTYDAKEAKEVGNKIAGAQKAKYDAKAESGAVVKKKSGNPKMKEAMVLAKKIRKDGEKWTDAVKRAYAQLK